jgi:hypothetical protein
MSRDSAVGTASGYNWTAEGVGILVPVGPKIFSSQNRSDRLWDTPILLSSG